jgi:hypothetical protein
MRSCVSIRVVRFGSFAPFHCASTTATNVARFADIGDDSRIEMGAGLRAEDSSPATRRVLDGMSTLAAEAVATTKITINSHFIFFIPCVLCDL